MRPEMIRPVGKLMLVRVVPKPRAGLILTVQTNDEPYEVTLMGKGKGVELEAELGDTLLLAAYSGAKFDKTNEDLLLVTDRDVLGVVI